jgi:glucose-6-phosphate 1-dehydrogenase
VKKIAQKEPAANLSALLVIFGGTGDLTNRKLMPALYNLVCEDLLPEHFAVVAAGRKEKTQEQYRDEVFSAINRFSRNKVQENKWRKLKELIYYFQFDFSEMRGYAHLRNFLSDLDEKYHSGGNRVFYLAVAPEYFEIIVNGIMIHDLAQKNSAWKRLVLEKPFGRDLFTARALNEKLSQAFTEQNIYRIDHYLGKEMIQNIMVLRFCNSLFESLWNNKYIDHVQISLNEKEGIGTRGGYYENSGAMRDMVQNHILQTLSLIAMEPPVNLKAEAIRNEKLKVIQAIEEFTPEKIRAHVVFGQYAAAVVEGSPVAGYREEAQVAGDSNTETYVAMKLYINNFRWAGTPFYIRTGKRLASKAAEIIIQFKNAPQVLYFKDKRVQDPNLLVIRIQPDVGVYFQFNTKRFGTYEDIVSVKMDTRNASYTSGNTPEAYERLIFDILRGDTTLFSSWDEVEASWTFADRIIEYKKQRQTEVPNYRAGTMGPLQAEKLLTRDGRKWWDI